MKATLWLCSIVTTMLTQSIYATPLIHYQYSYPPKSLYKENVLTEMKRTKPSLSIVNPLDVLRQRLLLEIARRQMRENSKQVEKNRMILKTVGKRTEGTEDDGETGTSLGDWQPIRLPQLKSQAWQRIHRSDPHPPFPALYDLYHEMDIRNHRTIDDVSNSLDNTEMDPNRTPAKGSESLAAADYDEEGAHGSGLNI